MKRRKILHGVVALIAFMILAFAMSSANAQTSDTPPGAGEDAGFSGDSGGFGAWDTGGGGGYTYPGYGTDTGGGGGATPDNGGGNSGNQGSGYCASVPSAPFKNVSEILQFITCTLLQAIVPLIFSVALAVFLWGMVKFIQAADSSEKEEGRQFMIWGVIALAVMLSVWGLVDVLNNTFGIRTVVPQLPVNK